MYLCMHTRTHAQSSSGRWHAQRAANLLFANKYSHTGLLKGLDLLELTYYTIETRETPHEG